MKHTQIWSVLAIGIICLFSVSCENENDSIESLSQNELTATINGFDDLIKEALEKEPIVTSKTFGPVETVDHVDLSRYPGRWYEIASFPNFFSQNCNCTTADYTSIEGGVSVFNNCILATTGNTSSINGTALVADTTSNAKFDLFLGPVSSDYWIIDLVSFNNETPYDFSVVSGPSRETLFILSRTPRIETFKQKIAVVGILINLIKQGYDIRNLVATEQYSDCEYPEL
ncbi:lipocalin family protein [Aquimarina pacifica]|uniref:lipocalin family protein n=1 Tax=Aquimarina pacifica TaxID=1296415 RepID=UPI0004714517|nr:lipocalin family protein [Aquimarina pacifica]